MAISKEDVLEYISGLSVLELSELVKEFEEKFGVSAQPVAVAGAAVAGAADAAEEKTEFNVVLKDAGAKKINVIKVIRALTGLGLKEAKAVANYLNSQMAKFEAVEAGYDEALLRDDQGYIAEASGACFFIVRDGKLITPPNDNSLESITQATVIDLANDMGIEVVRRRITREEIYIADEAFFTGTAAEITPIRDVDARVIGCGSRGPVTEKIQSAYFDVVQGKNEKYIKHLTYVN